MIKAVAVNPFNADWRSRKLQALNDHLEHKSDKYCITDESATVPSAES